MNDYNPQQWGTPGTVGGAYVPHSATAASARGTRNMTGMEARMPEPPPPYTASPNPNAHQTPSQQRSPLNTTFSPASNAAAISNSAFIHSPIPSSASSNRLSAYLPPQGLPPSAFPPPPGTSARDRSGSRTRGVISSISAIAGKRRATDNVSPANAPGHFPRQRSESTAPDAFSPSSSYAYARPDQGPSAPSGRRSASVGVGPASVPGTASSSRDGSRSRNPNWQPGMPLPPPPPGPAPMSRSQSTDRSVEPEGAAIRSRFAQLPSRRMGAPLSPMPPTPADWIDQDAGQTRPAGSRSSKVTSEGMYTIMSAIEAGPEPSSSAFRDGFRRMAAMRDPSAKGIRDRRLEKRARSREPQTAIEPASPPWAADAPPPLVPLDTGNSSIGRRRHVARASASPRNLGNLGTPTSAKETLDSARSTDSKPDEQVLTSAKIAALVANPLEVNPSAAAKVQSSLPDVVTAGTAKPTIAGSPISSRHMKFQSPIEQASPVQLPDSAPLPVGQRKQRSDVVTGLNAFARGSMQRYRAFLEHEMIATDDTERIELFAQFFVAESRTRRDRYGKAFENMAGSDVLDLTRDLWRSHSGSARRGKTPANRIDTKVQWVTDEPSAVQAGSEFSSPAGAAFTPSTQGDSPNDYQGPSRSNSRPDFQRAGGFQPRLSPIMSTVMSAVPDEQDSRGRAPSRWWERSDGSESFAKGGGRKIEISKRESKYMGVRNLQQMEWDVEDSPGLGDPNDYHQLGPDEYPAEKVNWQQEATPNDNSHFPRTPMTPQHPGLDISRLVTLPPPYPRHYPAVSNKHPDLAPLRGTLRELQESSEAPEFRERYKAETVETSIDPQVVAKRRRELRRNIQARVSEGAVSFAEAAAQESSFEQDETKRYKALAKVNFTAFGKAVLTPLTSILSEKVATATKSLDTLRASILSTAAAYDPNATEESGDELPELVEKIALFKWLFEARDHLHKELFELQLESDNLYKQVILAPYLVTSNAEKAQEVEDFFANDNRDREIVFLTDTKARFTDFYATIEQSVTRGVEAQLSAFWDIAPSLLQIVERVPATDDTLSHFDVSIPQTELEENPTYNDYPMQYLYTLLAHAEKSAYQFIESQVNLCCLLHEVKLGVSGARLKVLLKQREKDALSRGEQTAGISEDVEGLRREEDAKLTKELKERVQVVEDQWASALGSALEACKGRVGEWLVESGGWEDGLDE